MGVGVDAVDVARFRRLLDRRPRFAARCFTETEQSDAGGSGDPAQSLAARFAAKEAGAKALGTGIQHGVTWKELEVRRLPGHRPNLFFSGRAQEIATQLGVRHISLSLTHSTTTAMAAVHLEN